MTRAELALLLGALPEDWRLFFELLAHIGPADQRGDRATWEHVDLGTRPRLLVREQFYRGERGRLKTGHVRARRAALGGPGRAAARATAGQLPGERAPVFATPRRARASPVERVLPGAQAGGDAAVGLARGSASTPSGTPARRCCSRRGKDVKQVQEWLGHADPASRCGPTST